MTSPTYIPGPDFSGLAQLGQAIGQIINPGAQKEKEVEDFFLANPQIGAQFAAAQREAERQFVESPPIDVGDASKRDLVPNVLEQFGVSSEKAQQIFKAFPESSEERLSGVKEQAELVRLRTEMAKNKYSQTIISSLTSRDVPNLQALQQSSELVLGTKLNEAQTQRLEEWSRYLEGLKESDPGQYIRAVMATASPKFLEDLQSREQLELGRDELSLRGELGRAGLRLEKEDQDLRREIAEADRELRARGLSLDERKTDLQERFGERGLKLDERRVRVSEGQLSIEERNLKLREKAAELQSISDSADRQLRIFDLTMEAQNNLDDALDRLSTALDEGSESEKEVAIQRANEASAMVRALSPSQGRVEFDPGGRGFITGRLKDVLFTRLAPGTLDVGMRAQYENFIGVFQEADPGSSFAEMFQQFRESESGQEFFGGLTEQEKGKFTLDAQAQFGAIARAQQEGERGLPPVDSLSDKSLAASIERVSKILETATPATHDFRARLDLQRRLTDLRREATRRRGFGGAL